MPMLKLSQLTHPQLIKDLQAQTKKDALNEMVDLIGASPKITDVAAYRRAILSREELTSTGIGLSVAIPHAKIAEVTDYVMAIGRRLSGIEFDSLDGQPVKLIFMVGAAERQAVEFVRLLAAIVNLIKKGDVRVKLMEADSPEAIHEILKAAEAEG